MSIPFFIPPSSLFIYRIHNKVLNLRLNNLELTFVFFYRLHSTFTIFYSIASIYLVSVDDGIYVL